MIVELITELKLELLIKKPIEGASLMFISINLLLSESCIANIPSLNESTTELTVLF